MHAEFGFVDFITRYGYTFEESIHAPTAGNDTSGSDAPAGIVHAVQGAVTYPLQDVRSAAEFASLMTVDPTISLGL